MSYLAIARKWRPRQFEDLTGQEHVVQILKNSIESNRVSHAYLFAGARGVGKTSVARIFAKVLRCPNVKDSVPCHTCPECLAISESRSIDVVEIDGASNNGVEAVRAIRENVMYGASDGKYKVYIIDEVHMLSTSAFNALLKTLEEPPPFVIFVFATTESQKIPLTILSRCQRFEFRRLTASQIASRIDYILRQEKIGMEPKAIQILAASSDGSLRDGLSLLDQVLSYSAGASPITEAHVTQALGLCDSDNILGFLEAIFSKDTATILSRVEKIYQSGTDLKFFCEKVLEEVRFLYLLVLNKNESKLGLNAEGLELSPSHWDRLQAIVQKTSLIQVERTAQILGKTIQSLHWSSLPRFVLEMSAIRMAHLDGIAETANPAPPAETAGVAEAASVEEPAGVTEPAVPPPVEMATNPTNPADRWKQFVNEVSKKKPRLGALISHASFKWAGDHLHLAFAGFYLASANDPKTKAELESLIAQYFGANTKVSFTAEVQGAHPSIEKVKNEEHLQKRKEILEHPLIAKTKQLLGADLVDIQTEEG